MFSCGLSSCLLQIKEKYEKNIFIDGMDDAVFHVRVVSGMNSLHKRRRENISFYDCVKAIIKEEITEQKQKSLVQLQNASQIKMKPCFQRRSRLARIQSSVSFTLLLFVVTRRRFTLSLSTVDNIVHAHNVVNCR